MRVGLIALLQESNTFLAHPTTLRHFEEDLLVTGESMRERMAGTHHEVAGFFHSLAEQQIEAVPLFAARALPFGTIEAAAFDELMWRLFEEVGKAGPLDGYLLAPHGATVSEQVPDVDGHWMSELRRMVGPNVPLIATADPHANLSPAMVDATDAILCYRTNPHTDQFQRGLEAGKLMGETLAGKIRPVQAACFPPMIINIERQCTSEPPCSEICRKVEEVRQQPGVLSASLFLGFPYADVPEFGSAMVVVTDGKPELAQAQANALGQLLWDQREPLQGALVSISEALDEAAQRPGPVCLLDMGDNVGGGSAADGTAIAHALHERQFGASFVCLFDPAAVKQATETGIGNHVELSMGGHTDALHGEPLTTTVKVISLHEGKFEEPEVRHGGFKSFDQGPTAIVRTQTGLTIMLTSRRMVPFSLQQLLSCHIQPEQFQVLVAKGVNAPIAAYQPVCRSFIRVNTPGSTTADLSLLEFHNRRRPMYPFESAMQWAP